MLLKAVNDISENKPYILNGERATKDEYEKQKYDDIRIRVPKGKRAIMKEYAAQRGESLNATINRLFDEAMQKDTP